MAIPTFDLALCPPGRMRRPYIKGGAVDTGRTLSGVSNSQDITGGGLVAVSYMAIGLGNADPAAQVYWSRLGGILNSGVRSIIVPLQTDFLRPGGFTAVLAQDHTRGAAAVNLSLNGIRPSDRPIVGGEWFSVSGPRRLDRAHVITDVLSATVNGDGTAAYTVTVAPPLREGYPAQSAALFDRPRCLMKLPPGGSIVSDVDASQWEWTTPDVEFIESFGST